ncbi:GNAT family N-acyltransferase [Oligoflexus tunisiensis]|uniref:GNAT family N-acyltransferase n=1 Tax=Oligoflexus tunisiensis TaxID=708132 RepID=UPI00159F08BB|nr:GNAT family N-acyltransferase [Oligoflexus tunisiensis]
MKASLTQWQRHRIAQTLWQQNSGRIGFRWFHEQGLPAPFVLDEVQIEVTTELSPDILQLRLRAAQADGRLLQTNNREKCRDSFDAQAVHIKLILRDQLVAAGRLLFLDGQRERSEISSVLVPLPDTLITAPGTVEISRVCTHPDFRRGHLLTLLLAECAWAAFKRGGRMLLGYCVKSLIPVYLRFAGELLPYSGRHPLYEGRESCVVCIDLEKVMRGENVPFLAWARFVAPHVDEALGPAARDWVLRVKTQSVRLIQPCLDEVLKFTLSCSV